MVTLLIVLGYLATAVLPAAWAMQSLATTWAYCHQEPTSGAAYKWGRANCRRFDKPDCWRADGVVSLEHPALIAMGTAAGVIWPLLILPALAVHIAKRKPTPVALQRRIAELEKEVDL